MARLIEEAKQFKTSGMDTDSAIEKIDQVDFIEAWNFINTGNIQGEYGDGTNLASTVEMLGYDMPAGLNKGMGAGSFLEVRKSYILIYNSFGHHQLVEFDYDTNTKTLLFTDLIDSDGIPVLGFTPRNYIMDMKLAEGNVLIFTDSNQEIFSINISRLKSGGYSPATYNDFRLIKAQPLKVPTAVYGDDGGRVVNLMKTKLFQFNEIFYYLDDEPSTYSAWSKRPVPTKESTTSVGDDVTKNNNIIVTVDIGTPRVAEIRVGARYSLYDWFIIKSVTRAYIISLTSTVIDIPNQIYEAYDAVNNTYSFVFYNDGSYPNIDPTETDLEYDRVPRKAETLELLDQNILAVAGITEGYERPSVPVLLSVSDYNANLQGGAIDPNPLSITTMYNTDPPGKVHKRQIWVKFKGVAKTGDKIKLVVADFRNSTIQKSYEYTVLSPQNNDTFGALYLFALQMANGGGPGGVGVSVYPSGDEWVFTWIDFEYYSNLYGTISLVSVGSGVLSSIPALKSNSAYQAALQIYDEYGRPFPLITGNDYIFKTNSYAQSEGLTPVFNWQILNPIAPVGAFSYQWLLSENTTHLKTLYVNSKYLRTDGQYMVLSINPLKVFNERNSSSVLNYSYSEGDRVTFMYYDDSGTKVYFNDPFIDVQVSGFEIVTDTTPDPDTVTYELKVGLNPNINIADITNKNIYIEIYTPKKRVVTEGDTTTYLTNLFYEVGEQFNIVDGQFTVLSGSITDGDIYFQTRDYVSAIDEVTYSTYLAEDFNFSPVYESKYTSYGRGWLYNDRDGIKTRKASIRYSDKLIIDSRTNLLNRFYAERIYGEGDGETSSVFGWIRKIRQRDNYLVILQELKVGHVGIFNTIVEDQVGQTQAFLSDKLFNKVRYSQTGNKGIGNARESVSESTNGTLYFADPNNSLPMSEGYNGLVDIPKKMSKFFKGFIQKAKQEGRDIVSTWDNYTEKMIMCVQVLADGITQVIINATSLIYQDDYTVASDEITIVTPPTKGTLNFIGGEWVFTGNVGETGSDSFVMSFVVDGDTITKNVCLFIEAGDKSIVPFLFIDITNAELSTVYPSNIIFVQGINIPVPISITGGEYSINGGAWVTTPGTVVNSDEVVVRRMSSASFVTTVSAVLTISGYSDSFDITTKNDLTPDPFSFVAVTNAEPSTLYTSNIITPTGYGAATAISIVGGEYRVNGGTWLSSPSTISPTDTVQVRQTSSTAYNTLKTVTLTIGGVNGTYDVTTRVAVTVPLNYQTIYGVDPIVWNGLRFMRNDVYLPDSYNIFSETTGTITGVFFEGDKVNIRQISFPDVFPWPPTPNANLKIDLNGVEVYNDNKTLPQVVEVQDYTILTIPAGSTGIDVTSTGSSTDVGYLTYGLISNNLLTQDDLEVKIDDNTGANMVIDVTPAAGTSSFQFNVLNNADELTVTATNNSASMATIQITGEGGYSEIANINSGDSFIKSDVPKGNVAVSISAYVPPISCGSSETYSGGEAFPSERTIILGADTGTVNFDFDALDVPDKAVVIFDGVEVINTGYRGDMFYQTELDANLTARGLPTETIVSPGNVSTSFVKSTATTTAIVRVYAPLSGTGWNYTLFCPIP